MKLSGMKLSEMKLSAVSHQYSALSFPNKLSAES
jgi:hypothetical protein